MRLTRRVGSDQSGPWGHGLDSYVSFFHLFHNYSLSTCHVPGTMLRAGDYGYEQCRWEQVATGTTIHMNYNMNGVHGLRITMQLEVPSFQGAYILMAEGKSRWDRGKISKEIKMISNFWLKLTKEKKADGKIESSWGLEGKALIKLHGQENFSLLRSWRWSWER